MSADRQVSRRDFLRLRRTERGKLLEVSCQALFMRTADAAIEPDPSQDWEPGMGEPPSVIHRRSADDLIASLEHDLRGAQILRLLEPEWLENMPASERIQGVIAAFRARGGIVE
jgi:hypothetical protein